MTSDAVAPFVAHEFRVMGTDAQLLSCAPQEQARPVLEDVEAELHSLSARLTRFDPSSELEQLNDSGHGRVSRPLRELLRHAHAATAATDGRFEIGVGADLIAAGYDRTFDLVAKPEAEVRARGAVTPDATSLATESARSTPPAREASFTLEPDGMVRIRPGVRLDLGGIAKGWSADGACQRIAAMTNASCLVNLGGDIAVFVREGDAPWPIGITVGDQQQAVGLAFGGLATSGQDKRVWHAPDGSGLAHHVIDPRTGRSSATDVLRITVIAESSMRAETWTKALMLEGFDCAVREALERELTAVVVATDGRVRCTGTLESLNPAIP